MSCPFEVEGDTFRTISIISAISESCAPSTVFSRMAAILETTLPDTKLPRIVYEGIEIRADGAVKDDACRETGEA